jgi:hypothetical protein
MAIRHWVRIANSLEPKIWMAAARLSRAAAIQILGSSKSILLSVVPQLPSNQEYSDFQLSEVQIIV